MWTQSSTIWLALLFVRSYALTAYDCGRTSPNVTRFSTYDIAPCVFDADEPNIANIDLQLLQLVDHLPTPIQICRVRVDRHIRHCGWLSHSSGVHQGETTYFLAMNREDCADLNRHGQMEYEKIIVRDLIANVTNFRSLTVAGEINRDGSCSGTTYNVNDMTFKSVVVTVKLEIYFSDQTAPANVDKAEIILATGTRCSLLANKCVDAEQSRIYWNHIPTSTCNFDRYVALFEGKGVRISGHTPSSPTVYFANSTREIQFGLTKTEEVTLCGYTLYRTEHPKLYITEYSPDRAPPVRKDIPVEDVLISAYFNSKISYLARHVKAQFVSLYRDILMHRCQLERSILENSLMHIHTKPDLVALKIMKKHGYMAVESGGWAHLIPCEPTTCTVRHVDRCYQELPVTCRNESFFLKPHSLIMTRTGTPTDCNSMLPAGFLIDGAWYQFTPSISHTEEPQMLKPSTTPTWKYRDLQGIMESGIYRPQDLEKLREHFLFPAEKPAILDEVARRLAGHQGSSAYSPQFKNLLDSASIEEIAESKIRQVWDGFTQFGIYAAGVMGLVTIFQVIKLIADTIIRGYTLRTVYGWSLHLLGAIWGSMTHLLVTMANTPPAEGKPSEAQLRAQPSVPSNEDIEAQASEIEKRLQTYLVKAGA